MPNTTPVPELIAEEIESRLNTILLENGYAFDVSEVVRPNRRGDNWLYKHLGIGIKQGSSVRVPKLDCPGNPAAIAYATLFTLTCICRDSKNLDFAHATNENEVAAAAVKAIASDGDDWHSMAGVAINTEIGSPIPLVPPAAEINGVSVPVVVTYRVSENNPYEVRG
jgi:hypothetical protein